MRAPCTKPSIKKIRNAWKEFTYIKHHLEFHGFRYYTFESEKTSNLKPNKKSAIHVFIRGSTAFLISWQKMEHMRKYSDGMTIFLQSCSDSSNGLKIRHKELKEVFTFDQFYEAMGSHIYFDHYFKIERSFLAPLEGSDRTEKVFPDAWDLIYCYYHR